MSNLPYKNPISPLQVLGSSSVSRTDTFGTNFSVLGTGGFMEVYNLSDLDYTIPIGQTGTIEFSGNTIPIQFKKGSGSVFSPDVLTLNSDNISSGRRRLGMLVYVYETKLIYQHTIDNYDNLWSAATAASGPGGATVVISDFGTTVKNNTAAGQNFINAWTGSTIEGVSGYTSSNATWRVLQTGGGSGSTISGDYLPLSGGTVSGGTVFQSGLTANTISATTYLNLPVTADTFVTGFTFNTSTYDLTIGQNNGQSPLTQSLSILASDLTVTGGTYDPNTGVATFTNNTGGTFQVSGFTSGLTDTVITNFTYTPSANTFTITDSRSSAFTATIQSMTGLTATIISATTYQNLPNTIYTGDGVLLSNRIVSLSSFTLNFSSSTTNNLLFLSGSSVGIGTSNPLYNLDVSGNARISSDSLINELTVGKGSGNISTNTAFGIGALSSNTTGSQNTALGFNALSKNTTAGFNLGIGDESLKEVTRSQANTGVGAESLKNYTGVTGNTLGGNTGIGALAIRDLRQGTYNTGVGYAPFLVMTGGSQNVAVGYNTMRYSLYGENNVFVGTSAGSFFGLNPTNSDQLNSNLSGATYIGWLTRPLTNVVSDNETIIGYNTVGNGSNSVTIGNSAVTKTILRSNLGVGTQSPTNSFHLSGVTDPIRIQGLTANTSDTNILSIDSSGVVHTFPLSGITGSSVSGNFLPLSGGTVTGPTIFTSAITSNNITITGTTTLTSLSGTTNRVVQVNSGGTVSATLNIVDAYINSGSTAASLLSNYNNWDVYGVYTGTTITGTYFGQKHFDDNYFYEAVADNLFIRLIRG